MAHPYWPLFDLRVRTPRLELRYPDDLDAVALAELAAKGIHDPEWMPFSIPWTDVPSPEFERNALQHYWLMRATHRPDDWTLTMVAVVDGAVVGTQAIGGKDFAARRAVETGSWLGRAHQGLGIGKEMRSAVLHLAFAGLNAEVAYTAAWHDNQPSLGVTRALGYEPNGDRIEMRRDRADLQLAFKLTRERWLERRRDDITIENLDPCLPLLAADQNARVEDAARVEG